MPIRRALGQKGRRGGKGRGRAEWSGVEPRGRGSRASERKRALSLTVADVHGVEDWRRRRLLISILSSRCLGNTLPTTKQKVVGILYVCRTHFFSSVKEDESFIPCQVSILIPSVCICLGLGVRDLFVITSRQRHRAVMATICRSLCWSCGKVLSSARGSSEGTSKKVPSGILYEENCGARRCPAGRKEKAGDA